MIWPKNAPRVLGIRLFDCPNLSEKVLESQAESREIFGQFGSARPSVGQSKKICPNADPWSRSLFFEDSLLRPDPLTISYLIYCVVKQTTRQQSASGTRPAQSARIRGTAARMSASSSSKARSEFRTIFSFRSTPSEWSLARRERISRSFVSHLPPNRFQPSF